MARESKWLRVSKANPCGICQHDSFCTVSADGTLYHCMRVESGKPSRSRLGGWIHASGNTASEKPAALPRKEQPRPAIDWHSEARKMFEHKRAQETREALSKTLGVGVQSLRQLGVGYGVDHRSEFSSWPERDVNGKVLGIIRRYPDGAKKTMRWSRHGIYFAKNWPASTDLVLCPEGGSDTAALLTMGLYAIGRPSNVGGVDLLTALLRKLKPLRVIVLGERDEKPAKKGTLESCPLTCVGCPNCYPGRYGMLSTAEQLARRLPRCEVLVAMPQAKDVRAWLNERRGNGNLARNFINSLEPTTKERFESCRALTA